MRTALPDILSLLCRRTNPVFAHDALARLTRHQGYARAEPFPHAALDGLFDPRLLHAIVKEFPGPEANAVESHNDGTYVRQKYNTTWETRFGPETRRLFAAMASPAWLLALERPRNV